MIDRRRFLKLIAAVSAAASSPLALPKRASAGSTSSTVALTWSSMAGLGPVSIALSPDPSLTITKTIVSGLPDGTTSFTVTGLAPGVDCFFRVQAGSQMQLLYAKTLGGPTVGRTN